MSLGKDLKRPGKMNSIRYLGLVTCALLAPACGHRPCSKLSISREVVSLEGASPLPLALWRTAPSPSPSPPPSDPSPPALVTPHATNGSLGQQFSPSPLRADVSPTPTPTSGTPGTSGLCWKAREGGAVALAPDYRGNLWAVTTDAQGADLGPGRVWFLNFTSLTWRHMDAASPPESSSTEARSSLPTATASSGDSYVAPEAAPVALCSWSRGLVMLFAQNGSTSIWKFSVETGRWHPFQHSKLPKSVDSVEASWCGTRTDIIWLLTTKGSKPEVTVQSDLGSARGTGQTLWKLDGQGKWTPLEVEPTGGGRPFEPSAKVLQSWSDLRGNLFLLLEYEATGTRMNVIMFDTLSGKRTTTALKAESWWSTWIPGPTGELYAIYPRDDGSLVAMFDYYSGSIESVETAAIGVNSDSLFVRVEGVVYTTIPACGRLLPSLPQKPSPPDLRFSHVTLSRKCHASDTATLASKQDTMRLRELPKTRTLSDVPPVHRYVSDTSDSSADASLTESGRNGHATILNSRGADPVLSHTTGKSEDIVLEGVNHKEPVRPGGKHQLDKSHTTDSIIFFSLSLSIFALVGIVVFIRRCVRCPPTRRGLGDASEDRGKPPSPLPVLYSIVPDDPAYETSGTESPCISHHAIYDTSPYADMPSVAPNYMTPNAMTPNAMTPNAMTPNCMTPTATTPPSASPNMNSRAPVIPTSPGEFPKDALTYAITHSASDAINIATNNAFNTYISTTQF